MPCEEGAQSNGVYIQTENSTENETSCFQTYSFNSGNAGICALLFSCELERCIVQCRPIFPMPHITDTFKGKKTWRPAGSEKAKVALNQLPR